MEQQGYVDEHGEVIKSKDYRKKLIFIGIGVGLIIILTIIIMIAVNISRNKKCNSIEDSFADEVLKYAEDNDLLPDALSESVEINASDLLDNGYLQEGFTFDEQTCGGKAKITYVDGEYVVTVDVTNCDRCSASSRYSEWSDWQEKLPNKQIVDVEVRYNYVEKTTNYTEWTNYYTPKQLTNNPITDYTDDRFVTISKDAKNIEIVSENLTYYRYRDKRWKFYRNNNADYSDFSSVQPSGYANKDTSTSRTTEWSEWSVNAPEEASYRRIETKTGYRWYYEEGKEKIYYNGGQYLPEAPDDKYTERDKDDKATIYRYRDTEWRWYNGEKRGYSSFMSEATSTYKYKDEGLVSYSNYSSWSTTSKVDSSNDNYREEETEIRTRYRLKYDLYSYNLLSESVLKEGFASATGMSLEEVLNNSSYAVVFEYRYRYKK